MDFKFKWTSEMSVNNDVIDEQHKNLFEHINKLLDSIIDDSYDQKMIEDMVDFFENYMNEHLLYEEAYLQEMKYPYLEEHHAQHEVFVKKYKELKQKLDEKEVDKKQMIFDMENFMGNWLSAHIMTEDKKYANHFLENK